MDPKIVVRLLTILLLGLAAAPAAAQQDEPPPVGAGVDARPIAGGLAVPIHLKEPDDGSGRRFVVDQTGQIRIIDRDDRLLDGPFLDVSQVLVDLDPDYDERGLLGLAFHPDYRENGRFFIYYSAPAREQAPSGWDHTSRLSEFRVSDEDPNRADPESERLVMSIDQPYNNHNAGHIAFGQDGLLYVPLGDGGNGGDQDAPDDDLAPRPDEGNGQDRTTLLGSVLRIDVDGERPYAVPDDNPFVGEEGRDEIWAHGFRNPYGFSVDRENGDLWAFNAGQALFEEAGRVHRGGNHGWNIKEGTHCFDPDDYTEPPESCPDEDQYGRPLLDPDVEYRRGPRTGSTIVSGVRYRGDAIPALRDQVVFGDYSRVRFVPDGVIYSAEPREDGLWPMRRVEIRNRLDGRADGKLDRFLIAIEQDAEGELYALTTKSGGPSGDTGEVLALTAPDSGGDEGGTSPWWIALAALAGVALIALGGVAVARRRRRAEG